MNVGSLFSGIGGFDLGFERAGMRTLWFCEQDSYCQRVLARHWPGVPCHPDVRTLVADTGSSAWNGREDRAVGVSASGQATEWSEGVDQPARGSDLREGSLSVSVPYVDVLCGGFPCQDISLAGRGAGIEGQRSGLWREFARLVGELRPRYVVVENVPALASRGLDRVLADLAACGFDAEWDHLPASAFGAPHRRDRLWLVGYPHEQRLEGGGSEGHAFSHPHGEGRLSAGPSSAVEYSKGVGCRQGSWEFGGLGAEERGWWLSEPDVGRVAHGVSHWVDRLRALGNALVPQIAQWIGERIVSWEAMP